MLMWEFSPGKPPFFNCEPEYNLAMNIINGIRPKIVPRTHLEYFETSCTNNVLCTSKLLQFENLPEPKNATEEEQESIINNFLLLNIEIFIGKSYDFEIPDNIQDFNIYRVVRQTFKSSSNVFNIDKLQSMVQYV
ncbi:kinase-like domain-containing protein [Rhizophagus clarus]|uniref:Kinase-like domain-containing protein n=1 Tax=Rhizophagus clarus TaxID=94130 RepID=A0A8H3QIA2_9GLOM|nr:kinase-like domain-containing protein [Rhizophagus clarus]